MKQIDAKRLGLSFAGCFLGAGYVSGQELWQFFGSFGYKGIFGLAFALILICLVGIMLLRLNEKTGIGEPDKLVVMWPSPVLRSAVTLLELLFLFGVCTIMSAGVGALIEQLFGIPAFVGSGAFAVLVAAASLAGLSGMVKAFSATVPVLCGVTVVFGIMSLAGDNGTLKAIFTAGETGRAANPLMGSWLIAALSFACYNIFGSIAMIAPLGSCLKRRSTAISGIFAGGAVLLLIALGVLISCCSAPEFTSAELPMLALASSKGAAVGYLYGALLLIAMFGTSLSSMVGLMNMLTAKSEKVGAHRTGFTAAISAAVFTGSLFGFGELIGVIYPMFGYCSSVFIVLMTIHFVKVKKNENKA